MCLQNYLNKKTLDKGTELKFPQLEIALINFIEFNHKFFNPIRLGL